MEVEYLLEGRHLYQRKNDERGMENRKLTTAPRPPPNASVEERANAPTTRLASRL